MPASIFYTILVVAIIWTFISIAGTTCSFYEYYTIKSRPNVINIRFEFRPWTIIANIIVSIYWIWMIVRFFTN